MGTRLLISLQLIVCELVARGASCNYSEILSGQTMIDLDTNGTRCVPTPFETEECCVKPDSDQGCFRKGNLSANNAQNVCI